MQNMKVNYHPKTTHFSLNMWVCLSALSFLCPGILCVIEFHLKTTHACLCIYTVWGRERLDVWEMSLEPGPQTSDVVCVFGDSGISSACAWSAGRTW